MSHAPDEEEDLPSPRRGALPVRPSDLEQAMPFVPDAEPSVPDPEEDEDRPGEAAAPPGVPGGADD